MLVGPSRPWCRSGARASAGPAARRVGIMLPLLAFARPARLSARLPQSAAHQRRDDRPGIAAAVRGAGASARGGGQLRAPIPGARFAELQAKAYPELRTLTSSAPAEEAFELVEETVRKLALAGGRRRAADRPAGSRPACSKPPTRRMMVGLHGRHRRSRRGQRHPLAHRRALRLALRHLRLRPECGAGAQVPRGGPGARRRRPAPSPAGAAPRSARARALLKRQKERDQEKAGSRSGRGRAQSSAQRAPAQKETAALSSLGFRSR